MNTARSPGYIYPLNGSASMLSSGPNPPPACEKGISSLISFLMETAQADHRLADAGRRHPAYSSPCLGLQHTVGVVRNPSRLKTRRLLVPDEPRASEFLARPIGATPKSYL